MTSTAHTRPVSTRTWTWKDIVFPIVALAVALLLASGTLQYFVLPWFPHLEIHDPKVAVPVMHLWHYAQAGVHSLLLMTLPLLLVIWRPRERVLLMQFVLVTFALLALLILPWRSSDSVVVGILFVVLFALYPDIRRLAQRPKLDRLSRPLLGLTLVCVPFLLYEALRLVVWQVSGVGGEHATAGHWIAAATIPPSIIAAGLFAATKRPGWLELGLLTGGSLLYLGAASFALRYYDGSWGSTWGLVSLIGGVAYIVVTLREARR